MIILVKIWHMEILSEEKLFAKSTYIFNTFFNIAIVVRGRHYTPRFNNSQLLNVAVSVEFLFRICKCTFWQIHEKWWKVLPWIWSLFFDSISNLHCWSGIKPNLGDQVHLNRREYYRVIYCKIKRRIVKNLF